MAQQTAVEWLEDVYNTQGHILPSQFEQANQMFEEQIKTAYLKGKADGSDEREGSYTKYLDEIDFFNETYKPV